MKIYFQIRDYVNKRGMSPIRLVIMSDRQNVLRRNTGVEIPKQYWDDGAQCVKGKYADAQDCNARLAAMMKEARGKHYVAESAGRKPKAKAIADSMNVGNTFKAIAEFVAVKHGETPAQEVRADRYRAHARKVVEYAPGVEWHEMDADWLDDYGRWMAAGSETRPASMHNTIVSRKRTLSRILKLAVKHNLIPYNPLAEATKGTYHPGDVLHLEPKELERLWKHKPATKWEQIARATFLFSFYAAGMRFTDVLLLPKTAMSLRGDVVRLKWKPNKTLANTGQYNEIPVNPRLAELIKLAGAIHGGVDPTTLFGLVDSKLQGREQKKAIGRVEALINQALKMLMLRIRVGKSISFNCARHGFARLANELSNRDVYSIKSALGHGNMRTTEGYLGLDQSAVDKLCAKVYGAA